MKSSIFYCLIISFLISSCISSSNISKLEGPQKIDNFEKYWYQGKAEINTYKLEQARYGEIHEGSAMLLFVTEPFNIKKQVKADHASATENTSILKSNQTRKFNTGIYPYSTMTSVFTPVNISAASASLKVTNSVQEWCGQVFMQMNKSKSQYKIESYSYFESEGDRSLTLPAVLLEDEVFNLIRINPEGLPIGNISVLPTSVYLRFMHKDIKAYKAIASKTSTVFNKQEVVKYSISYANSDREISVFFNKEEPFEIQGWEEKYKSFGGNILTTKAIKVNQIQSDYWNKNSVSDSLLYQQLFNF